MQDLRVAFDCDVRLFKGSRVPGISAAADGVRYIIKPDISDNLSVRRISGMNLGTAVNEFVRLIEIRSFGYIGGNQ